MKCKVIETGSGAPNKILNNKEVYELIYITNCFPELREKKQINNKFILNK